MNRPDFRWAVLGALVFAVISSSGCARRVARPEFNLGAYRTIAVMPFHSEDFLQRYGSEVSDQIVIELLRRDPEIRIVDVPAAALEDTTRGHTATPDPADPEARYTAAARASGATLVVTGSCIIRLDWVRRAWTSRQAYATATVRAVDPRDRRVIWAGRETATAESQVYSLEGDTSAVRVESSDPELREEAIVRLAQGIASELLGK